jgi:nucleotide-binding universal stress UspA family protein
MFNKVVFAYDGSEGARVALERIKEWLERAHPELHLVSVGRLPEYAETRDEIDDAREQAEKHYGKILEEALVELGKICVEAKTHVLFGKPSEEILHQAAEVGADLIVLGTHPKNVVRRRLLGGTADKILDYAHCSVLVVKEA